MVTYLENLKDELNYCILNGEEYLKGSNKLKQLGKVIISDNNKSKAYEILSNSIIELLNTMEMKSALEAYSLISHMLIILDDEEKAIKMEKAKEVMPNKMKYEAIPLQKFNENKLCSDIRNMEAFLSNLTDTTDYRLQTTYYNMKKEGLEEVVKQYVIALDLKTCKLKNPTEFLKYFGDLQGENTKEILIDIFNNRRIEYKRGALLALAKLPEARDFVLEQCSVKDYIQYRQQCKTMMKDKNIAKEVYEEMKKSNFRSLFNNTINIISSELYGFIKEAKSSNEMKTGYLSKFIYQGGSPGYLGKYNYEDKPEVVQQQIVEYLKKWGGNSPWLL